MSVSALVVAPPSRRELRVDAAIAGGILVIAALSTGLYTVAGVYDDPAPGWATGLWLLAISAPLAWRRRHPVLVALAVAAAFMIGGIVHVPELLVGSIALFLAIYTAGAQVQDRRLALLIRLGITVAMFIWLVIALLQQATDPDALSGLSRAGAFSPLIAFLMLQILTNLLYFGAAFYFGDRAWIAAQQRAALERRTAELERERERTARQAVALDRVRIARELHDVVAHHVSVIGIQAGAARTAMTSHPDAARTALGIVEETARTVIDELHRMLVTLRDDRDEEAELGGGLERGDGTAALGTAPDGTAADTAPGGAAAGHSGWRGGEAAAAATPSTVGVAALPRLVESSAGSGLPTSFAVVGDPRPVGPVVGLNVYRIAQEALTNVRKHAGPGATADVRLRYLSDAIEVEVGNTGAVASRRTPGGLGQLGIRERVAASGGTLELGPRSRGGYLVRARLPLSAAAGAAVGSAVVPAVVGHDAPAAGRGA